MRDYFIFDKRPRCWMKCTVSALLLREKEDIEDRHERHQLVPSCCQKPHKSPARLHCRDLTTRTYIWKVGMNAIRHVQDSADALQRYWTAAPTWSRQKQPEQRQQALQGSHSSTSQHFSWSHHIMTWPEEAMAWRRGRNGRFYQWQHSSIPTVGCAICLHAAPQVK